MASSRTTGSACATATKPNAAIIVMIERFIIWQMLFCTLAFNTFIYGMQAGDLLTSPHEKNPLPIH
jgi:hypothetical protein